MQENKDQNNSEYGQFSRNANWILIKDYLIKIMLRSSARFGHAIKESWHKEIIFAIIKKDALVFFIS